MAEDISHETTAKGIANPAAEATTRQAICQVIEQRGRRPSREAARSTEVGGTIGPPCGYRAVPGHFPSVKKTGSSMYRVAADERSWWAQATEHVVVMRHRSMKILAK